LVGFILVALGLLAVWTAVSRTRAGRLGFGLLGLVEAVRFSPAPTTSFGLGLLLLAAVTIWRSEVLPRVRGILFALFLPQVSTAPAVRIAHGGLVAAGSMWLVLALWRASRAQVGS
jgi:hypothetical protein